MGAVYSEEEKTSYVEGLEETWLGAARELEKKERAAFDQHGWVAFKRAWLGLALVTIGFSLQIVATLVAAPG